MLYWTCQWQSSQTEIFRKQIQIVTYFIVNDLIVAKKDSIQPRPQVINSIIGSISFFFSFIVSPTFSHIVLNRFINMYNVHFVIDLNYLSWSNLEWRLCSFKVYILLRLLHQTNVQMTVCVSAIMFLTCNNWLSGNWG